jgi:maltose O-acetyltransferase
MEAATLWKKEKRMEKANFDKMIAGEVYQQDKELLAIRLKTRDLLYDFNHIHPSQMEERKEIIKAMFHNTGEEIFVEQPFHCDYGVNITVGENFLANNNCTMTDVAPITIGDDCLIGPNVGIYTAGHALDPIRRKVEKKEFGQPVVIGNNVWLGGNSTILPGVTIGDDVVIGAGSVVTKDIPNGVLAYGNPCKVIRKFTQHDHDYYYKNLQYPAE